MKFTFKEFLTYATKPNAPLFTKIYWPISQPLSYILFLAGFSPNGISILGVLLAIVAGVTVFVGYPTTGVALFLLSYILDFCDGNVARVWYGPLNIPREGRQKLGLMLENFYANIAYALFFLSMGYYLYVQTGLFSYVWLGVVAYVIKIITRYTVLHVTLLNKKPSVSVAADAPGESDKLFKDEQANRAKYVFTNIIDNARVYFISFLIVLIFFAPYLAAFFTVYMVYVAFMNAVKLILTFIRQQP